MSLEGRNSSEVKAGEVEEVRMSAEGLQTDTTHCVTHCVRINVSCLTICLLRTLIHVIY